VDSGRPPPRTRVVLLGASNLALYLPRVVSLAREALAGPLEVFAAAGLGRSYGEWTRVLGRELPGVTGCGLWEALRSAHDERPLPTVALVVDVGNDLVYGAQAERVAGWVETCLAQLGEIGARSIVTLLPLPSIEALGRARFGFVRAILFPSHPIQLADVRREARALQEKLVALATEHDAAPVVQQGAWYGIDPIHIRMTRASRAWSTVLEAWGPPAGNAALSPDERRRLRRARPALRRTRGRDRTNEQPSCQLDDGTTLALY